MSLKPVTKYTLFKGVVTDLDIGEFRASIMVKFKNLELSAVIPKKMVTEWGLKVGDKVMVHIEEGGGIYIYKNKLT